MLMPPHDAEVDDTLTAADLVGVPQRQIVAERLADCVEVGGFGPFEETAAPVLGKLWQNLTRRRSLQSY